MRSDRGVRQLQAPCRFSPGGSLQMRCPSCGAISENSEFCADCGVETVQGYDQLEAGSPYEAEMKPAGETPTQQHPRKSTLIEFPGVSRSSLPEWRKELSERVREVQERRARDAAEEEERQRIEAAVSIAQLELLPRTEMPAMNPLVAAALKRIERAHQSGLAETRQPRTTLATAIAYAPEREENDMNETIVVASTPHLAFQTEIQSEDPLPVEKSHGLVVLPPSEPVATKTEPAPVPKRLIVDDPNDPVLNYLDSISKNVNVDELTANRAPTFRRLVCAVIDLTICGMLSSPIALAMRLQGGNLQDARAIGVLAGSAVVVTFIYLTLTTALTGRTWAMRLLSLRVIDTKTGLIPTGGQSVGRSFFYLISLATAGVGILFALLSREGQTAHDRFTRTAVITI